MVLACKALDEIRASGLDPEAETIFVDVTLPRSSGIGAATSCQPLLGHDQKVVVSM